MSDIKNDIDLKIVVADGKYTFITYKNDYKIYVQRYDEDWLIIEEGHKAISALLYEFDYMKSEIEAIENYKCKEM